MGKVNLTMNESHKPVSDRIVCIIIVLFLSTSVMIALPGRAAENILQTISPDQANRLILDNKENPNFLIIDIRTPEEFRTGHLEGAVLIDYYAKDFFNKTFLCGDELRDLRDGNYYNTVQIGTQCWVAENLAYLPSVSPSSAGSLSQSATFQR